jgi:hypothetical protein
VNRVLKYDNSKLPDNLETTLNHILKDVFVMPSLSMGILGDPGYRVRVRVRGKLDTPTVSPAEPRLGARVALQQSPILPEGKSHYKVNHYSMELPIYTK